MKVVLNKCYGGFGLSPLATKRYLELKGEECYFYKQTRYKHNGVADEYVKISVDEAQQDLSVIHVYKKYLGEKFSKWPTGQTDYFSEYDLDRSDPLLIKTIEELGEKKSSGHLAELKVIEIPDGIDWHIDDYDGIETLHKNHRSW